MTVATRWPLVGRRDELDTFSAALADPGCEGFCIYGPSGVGKTRLAEACAASAEEAGRRVFRAGADRSGEVVPLGAVAHLLPANSLEEVGDGDVKEAVVRARLLDAARRSLAESTATSGVPVLLLDDAHRLDGASLAMVDRLLIDGSVFGLATVMTGKVVPETITRWWRDERAVRLDLADLDPIGVDTLLHVVLQGPLDADASAQLWRACRGNVLALRELVLGALERQVLVFDERVWRLTGPLGTTTRLRELVEARIGGLDATARAALELLALCQPVGLSQLEARFGLTTLEALEMNGLISVRIDGRRAAVRLGHPLHEEVLRAALPTLGARSVLLAQAEAVETWGARRREDPMRVATWRLASTGRADPDLLVRGARLARFSRNHRQAADLARAALAGQPSAAAGLVLGESLYDLASYEEAETVLAEAISRASTDDELVRVATVRRRNLFWGCRRDADALAIGRTVAPRLQSPAARDELIVGEAEVLAYGGRPVEALALLDGVDETVPRVAVLAAIPRAAALATTGRTEEAIAVSQRGYDEHLALGDELAIAPAGTHVVNRTWALVEAGRLGEAEQLGRQWLDAAARVRMPLGVTWFCIHLARCALAQGRPATARQLAERALMNADMWGFEGLRPMANAVLAVSHCLLGNAAQSAAHADRTDPLMTGYGFLGPELSLGPAWALVAGGDLVAARTVLISAADAAEQAGHVPVAAGLLHDAIRLGARTSEAIRLAALASATDSVLVAAKADHAQALIDDDASRLAASADRFEAIGALLLAAEASTAAAGAWRRVHEPRRATALARRAAHLAHHCEGVMTPGLVDTNTVVLLTTRERDVAMLAAAGHASRVIAERLYLSVRTVENHLGHVYEKLGVSGRKALADAIGRDDA